MAAAIQKAPRAKLASHPILRARAPEIPRKAQRIRLIAGSKMTVEATSSLPKRYEKNKRGVIMIAATRTPPPKI